MAHYSPSEFDKLQRLERLSLLIHEVFSEMNACEAAWLQARDSSPEEYQTEMMAYRKRRLLHNLKRQSLGLRKEWKRLKEDFYWLHHSRV